MYYTKLWADHMEYGFINLCLICTLVKSALSLSDNVSNKVNTAFAFFGVDCLIPVRTSQPESSRTQSQQPLADWTHADDVVLVSAGVSS